MAIAIVTLHGLGMDVSRLMSGVQKISRFNRERFGTANNEKDYPTLAERQAFARAMAARTFSRNRCPLIESASRGAATGRVRCGAIVPHRAPVLQNGFLVGDSHQVEPSLNSVTGPAGTIRLEPKVMQVLVLLAAHAGQVVAKERLIQTVWPDTFVTDDVLTRAISELRRVFGDDAKEPRFIQTIPKSGYRLIARVSSGGADQEIAGLGQPVHLETVAAGDDHVIASARRDRSGERPRPNAVALMDAGPVGIGLAAVIVVGVVVCEPAARRHPGPARHDRRPALRTPRGSGARVSDGRSDRRNQCVARPDRSRASQREGADIDQALQEHVEVARGDRAGAGRRVSGGRDRSDRERPAARDGEADSRARPGADMGGVL